MTELLLNFLRFKTFRNDFLKLIINEDEIDTIEYEHLSTQNRLALGRGQPDFSIRNDQQEILIEIKTYDIDLTSNQPTSYLEHLAESDKAKRQIIFLIPSWYAHRNEWNRRLAEFQKNKNISISNLFPE